MKGKYYYKPVLEELKKTHEQRIIDLSNYIGIDKIMDIEKKEVS